MSSIFGWLVRHAIVFGAIVAALAFYYLVLPELLDGNTADRARLEWVSPEEMNDHLDRLKQETVDEFEASRKAIVDQSAAQLKQAIQVKQIELANVERRIATSQGLLASIRPSAILAREKLKLQQKKVAGEIALLRSASDLAMAREKVLTDTALPDVPSEKRVDQAQAQCRAADTNSRQFNRLSAARKAYLNLRYDRAEALSNALSAECGEYRTLLKARETGTAVVIKAREAALQFEEAERAFEDQTIELRQQIRSYEPEIVERTISSLLLQAFAILLGIILAPFLVRTLFYYAIAPLAQRRAAIRVSVPGGGSTPIPVPGPSRISIPVTLAQGEELLVRQNYLQTTSIAGTKSTRWLLDYRHIFSSIASGLSFLTRITGAGEVTTVSAVQDSFAELSEVHLPDDAACILHPRALVAVVQPKAQKLRISSHWRLFSLNAWLTLQLRYLVFHGPSRLILKGGRGIRVERAERGRIFGQDQLVGFSADLAYSVTRTETFAPYFFGREPLFKDKVEQGSGILIVEEAPLSARKGGVRRGLEGMFDAGMKAFGV